MQHSSTSELNILGLSDSPASSPLVVEGPDSPVKSVPLEMESDRGEDDPGMRTTDFFDNTSDSEPSDHAVAAGGIPVKRHSIGSSVQGVYHGNQGISSHLKNVGEYPSENSKLRQYLELTSSGADGSSTSQLISSTHSLDNGVGEAATSEGRPVSTRDVGPGRLANHASSRLSSKVNSQYGPSSIDKGQQILNLHSMSLQALTRDDESPAVASPRMSKDRDSVLDLKEPRQPVSALPQSKSNKRVTVIPPRISISDSEKQSPIKIVRTPYPFVHRKVFPPMSPISENSVDTISEESVMSICVRPNNANRPARVSRMVLPKSADLRASPNMASEDSKKKHFDSLDYDDSHFFQQLRSEYSKLRGPFRFLSAQTMQRITVEYYGHRSSSGARRPIRCSNNNSINNNNICCDHVESEAMRSPRLLAFKGLADTFSEEKLMQHYRNPRIGRARYSWVHWAHRIAASTAPALSKMPISTQTQMPMPVPTPPPPSSAATDATIPEDETSKSNNNNNNNNSTNINNKDDQNDTEATKTKYELDREDVSASASAAAAAANENINDDHINDDNSGVGLEFIEDWSVARIASALAIVLFFAVAAVLLWVFLGVGGGGGPASTASGGAAGNLQNTAGAGARVVTGLVFGVFVFLIGLVLVLAWLGVCWLVT